MVHAWPPFIGTCDTSHPYCSPGLSEGLGGVYPRARVGKNSTGSQHWKKGDIARWPRSREPRELRAAVCVCVCVHPKGWALSGVWVFTSLLAKEVRNPIKVSDV